MFPTIEFMTIQPPLADLEVMQDIVAKLWAFINEQIEHLTQYLLQKVRVKNDLVEGNLVDDLLLAAIS